MVLKVGAKSAESVTMTVPPRTTEREIDAFLREQRRWVERTLASSLKSASKLGRRKPGLAWRLGEALRLVRASNEGRSRARRGFTGSGEEVIGLFGPSSGLEQALERWCREEARRIAEAMIAEEAPKLGVSVRKLRIADQKTRWGSAASNGTVSLNWRLLLAPREVFDYVVIHELCHLLEMNHSARFWAHVERMRPDWRESRHWLRRHGAELRAWSVAEALGR